jgi:hypothetical protein
MSHKFMPFNPEALPKADAEFAAIDDSAKLKKTFSKGSIEIKDTQSKKAGEPTEDFEAKARFVDYVPKTYDEISKKNNSSAEAHLGEEIPEAPGAGKNRTELDDEKIEKAWKDKMAEKGNPDNAVSPTANPEKDASAYSPASKYFEELDGFDKKSAEKSPIEKTDPKNQETQEDKDKRRQELESKASSSRINFAKKNYESTSILSRLKELLPLRTKPRNLQENHDLYNQYQIDVNELLQFDIDELKSKNLPSEEFQKEMDRIAKYYHQDEKANLYDANNSARAKVWEEKFGKAPGWIAEQGGKFVNWYRKADWKKKMAFSIGAGLSGAGLLMVGQRILGGAAAGVGITTALESSYRKKEGVRLQGEREEMLKNVEGIGEQEQKCEALMKMLQKEVGGFQKDLQRERKGALKRKLLGATVGTIIGSGALSHFVKWGINEANAGQHLKTAWVGLVGSKNADLFAEKFGELGQFVGHAKQVAGEKLHGAADYAKGILQSEAYTMGTSPAGIVPEYGGGVAYSESHGGLPPEVSKGVVPSHGADVSNPGAGGNKYYEELKKAYNQKPKVDLSQKAPDLQNADLGKAGAAGLGETYTENSLKMTKGGYGGVGLETENSMKLDMNKGGYKGGMTQFEQDVRKSNLAKGVRPGAGMTQFEQDVRASSLGKGEMPKVPEQHIEPVGKISNQGMEKTYGHIEPVGKVSNEGFTNKILEIKKGSSIEHTMIKNGMDPREAHRMVLAYAKEQGIPASKLDLIHPGAKLVLSPDGKHIVNFQDSHQMEASKGPSKNIHEHKTGKHASRPRAGHVEKAEAVQAPEEKISPSPKISQHQLEEIRNIETENNSLVAKNAELQQKLARLDEQIKINKQGIALGQEYPNPSQIHSGSTLKSMVEGEMKSRNALQNQIDANNARIGALRKMYEEKLSSGKTGVPLAEDVSKSPASAAEIKNQDLSLQEKVGTVKTIRQDIVGGNVKEWNSIQNQPAQEMLKQKNSPVAVYYDYIIQENPGYARYIRPHRYEPIRLWTVRLGDYHHQHSGRFERFHLPPRRHW